MAELPFGERDRCGLYTLLDNDIVLFVIAKDKRDGIMRATQIALLDQSFLKSKERTIKGCRGRLGTGFSIGRIQPRAGDWQFQQ